MKKKMVLIILVLFCFGCSAKYDLVINDDLSVEETVTGLENNNFYSIYSLSKSNVVQSIIDSYSDLLNTQRYTTDKVEQDSMYGARASKKYKNLNDFKKNSNIYFQFYNSFNYENKNGIVTFSFDDKVMWDGADLERIIVDDGTVSITLPFKVLEHNADSHKDNTYTWNVNSFNDKNILIRFDTNSKNNLSISLIIITFIILVVFSAFVISFIYIKRRKNRNTI